MISTSDAVKMIRDMLRKAAQRAAPGEEDDEDEEEGVAEEEALAKGSVLSEDAEEGDKAGRYSSLPFCLL
jgi:DNA-directed RNA polymerase specialized sigma24 family protein